MIFLLKISLYTYVNGELCGCLFRTVKLGTNYNLRCVNFSILVSFCSLYLQKCTGLYKNVFLSDYSFFKKFEYI